MIGAALERAPGVDPEDVDDVMLGCAMPEAEQGLNVARIASLRAGIPVEASAVTVNRFCSSGLQAIAFAAERIMCGFASTIVAGGTESMSMVPMGGNKLSPNPTLIDSYPDVYLSTGLVAENHARESGISREEQDAFALRSHQRALAAIDDGRFARRSFRSRERCARGPRNANDVHDRRRAAPRHVGRGAGEAAASVSRERHRDGRQFVADERRRGGGRRDVGGACAGARPRRRSARFVAFATAGVEPERFGIGPVPAIRKVLKLAGLTLDQIDLVELNEAFAAQVLACLQRTADRPGRAERERRRHRARPSARLHGRQADDDPAVRNAAPQGPLRPGDDVRRRRHGRRRHLRTDVMQASRYPTIGLADGYDA